MVTPFLLLSVYLQSHPFCFQSVYGHPFCCFQSLYSHTLSAFSLFTVPPFLLSVSLQSHLFCWFQSVYWSSGPVTRTHCGWCLWHQRTWSTWLWFLILTVLLSSASVTLETSTDISGAWFLGCTQKSMSHHQSWLYEASLVQFEDARWRPDTSAFGTPSDHYSVALAPFLRRLSACEEVKTKACETKFNGCRNLRLQLYTPKISCQMITQSAYPSFAHSSHSTPSPITFQTDLV